MTGAIRETVKYFPEARYVEIENAEHEILMENDRIRGRFWGEFDSFVEAQLSKGSIGFLDARRGEQGQNFGV